MSDDDVVKEFTPKPTSADIEYREKLRRAETILPAWFISRMMNDNWNFGLMLTTGQTLFISQIDNVHIAGDQTIWIDVTMQSEEDARCSFWGKKWNLIGSPTSRLDASVNVAHIICAVEMADT